MNSPDVENQGAQSNVENKVMENVSDGEEFQYANPNVNYAPAIEIGHNSPRGDSRLEDKVIQLEKKRSLDIGSEPTVSTLL